MSYVVQNIFNHKEQKTGILVHVKWLGYEECTWEPLESMIVDVPDMVNNYFDVLKLQVKSDNGKFSLIPKIQTPIMNKTLRTTPY